MRGLFLKVFLWFWITLVGTAAAFATLVCDGECHIDANPELLRSATENIVRNAIRYTATGTSVEVHLESRDGNSGKEAIIRVSAQKNRAGGGLEVVMTIQAASDS